MTRQGVFAISTDTDFLQLIHRTLIRASLRLCHFSPVLIMQAMQNDVDLDLPGYYFQLVQTFLTTINKSA